MLRFQERKEKNEMKEFIRTRHGKVTDDSAISALRSQMKTLLLLRLELFVLPEVQGNSRLRLLVL